MNRKQKIAPLPRWLINIGLTLQFYIPCSINLFFVSMAVYALLNPPPGARAHPGPSEGSGLIFFLGLLILFALLAKITWLVIYWLWDRYGNRRFALGGLIVGNTLFGGAWFLVWSQAFYQGKPLKDPIVWLVKLTQRGDPFAWLISPSPVVIPTLFYFFALVLMIMRSKKNHEPVA